MNDHELTHFREQIDLVQFATSFGYALDRKESTAQTQTLRREDGGKLLVTMGRIGYPIFHDCRTLRHGSVIDFVQQETGEGLGRIRQRLRAWYGISPPSFSTGPKKPPDLLPVDEPDRRRIEAVWGAAVWNEQPDYLTGRGLTAESLADERFRETYRVNKNGVCLFLHHDRSGACGYEIRGMDAASGRQIKSFSKGQRGLWYSNNLKQARSVMVCESAIDCLSHYELYQWDIAYASIAGAISNKQKNLLMGLFEKVNDRDGRVSVGTDRDVAGEKYFEQMQALTGMKLDRLASVGKDWNADLLYIRREQA